MSKYTFVIPVYNVEKYLSECIESILHQNYHDFSIILVDDGSTDSSGELCESYGARYENIRVIHQKNAGLSEARNAGLRAAESEFVIFLDSDDYWCDSHGLEEIDTLIDSNVDVLCFASKNYNQDTGALSDDRYDYPQELNAMDSERCLEFMITHDRFNLSAAKKVYRRRFLMDNQLLFEPGIKSEDIEHGLRMVNYLPNYRFLNKKLYVYRHRDNSISATINANHLDDYYYIIEKFASYPYVNENVRKLSLSYLGYQYALLIGYVTIKDSENRKARLKKLKPYAFLLCYPGYPRTEKIYKFCRVFGFNLTRCLLGAMLRTK